MVTETFGNKKIIIRELAESDLQKVESFQRHINSLVKEDAKILINEEMSLQDEEDFVKRSLEDAKQRVGIKVVAEYNGEIVGISGIRMDRYRRDHMGILGSISIRDGYRGIGLGEYVTRFIIDLSKKRLKPKLKIITLTVYQDNKPAINLYKKVGFKKVATIPEAIQYKGKLLSEHIMILRV